MRTRDTITCMNRKSWIGCIGGLSLAFTFMSAVLLSSCSQKAESISTDKPLQVSVNLQTNVIHVGDTFEAIVDIVHPLDSVVQLPEPDRGKEVVIRDRYREEDAKDDHLRTTVTYFLTSFRLGEHTFATGTARCVTAEGKEWSYPLPPVTFEVVSTLTNNATAMQDIKEPIRWPSRFPGWIIILVVIALLAAAVAFIAGRFLSRPRTILHTPPPTPAHVIALRALHLLRDKGYIESADMEPFYVELSDIVRHYLENRFGLRAPERTTEEFIREATRSRVLSAHHQQVVRDFLEQSDLVKFARHQPMQDEMRNAYGAAEHLVEETKIQPADEEAKEEPS